MLWCTSSIYIQTSACVCPQSTLGEGLSIRRALMAHQRHTGEGHFWSAELSTPNHCIDKLA